MDNPKQISSRRRRIGAIAAGVVILLLGLTLWQTWDYWHPTDEMAVNVSPGGRRPAPPPAAMGGTTGAMPGQPEMRRRAQDQIKAALDVSEADWAKLQPKVEKVTRLQEQLRPRGGPMGRPGGPPMPDAQPDAQPAGQSDRRPVAADSASEFSEKTEMLRSAVDDEQTSDQALAANLAAARAARKKLEAELKTAQEELRKDLTPRQEAALAVLGVLD